MLLALPRTGKSQLNHTMEACGAIEGPEHPVVTDGHHAAHIRSHAAPTPACELDYIPGQVEAGSWSRPIVGDHPPADVAAFAPIVVGDVLAGHARQAGC